LDDDDSGDDEGDTDGADDEDGAVDWVVSGVLFEDGNVVDDRDIEN
jgi:hypothetical protein